MVLALVPSEPGQEREVLEFGRGVCAYAPEVGGRYWRIRWHEGGRRRDTTACSRDSAVGKASELVHRLGRGTPTDLRGATVADLVVHYLDPDRTPPRTAAWSIRHREEQTRYCEQYVVPMLGPMRCAQVTSADLNRVLASATTPSVADHLLGCLTALVNAGLDSGHLLPQQDVLRGVKVRRTGEAVDKDAAAVDRAVGPDEIPTAGLVHELAFAAAALRGVWWRGLEVLLTAYSGLRFGEHAALTGGRIDTAQGRIVVARQVIEPQHGGLVVTLPKGRRRRVTVFPAVTPLGVDLAGMVERRVGEVGRDGLLFPAPRGGWLRRSNYGRNVWTPAAEHVGWPRRQDDRWLWTFHSLRHVFATWALSLPGVSVEDVARFMGHAGARVTQDIYIHVTAAAYDRFRQASALTVASETPTVTPPVPLPAEQLSLLDYPAVASNN